MTLERTPIFVLFRVGCPFAIVGRIASFVIDAFKCKAGRLLAHVREKVFKAVQPAIAHCDAAHLVVKEIFLAVRIVATRFHFRPRAERRTPSARSMTMRTGQLLHDVNQKASARPRVAASQIACAGSHFGSAFTTTQPINARNTRRVSTPMRYTEYGQAAVLLTCDILEFGHRTAPIGSRSSDGRARQGSTVALVL